MKTAVMPWRTLLGVVCALISIPDTSRAAPSQALDLGLVPIGRYTNDGPFNLSAAEIVAHDPTTQRLYVVNGRDRRLDVLDIRNPANPVKVAMVDMSPYGN